MIAESFGASFFAVDLPFPCEIHFRAPMRLEQNDNFKVLVLHSEPSLLCIDVDSLLPISHFFDLIITSNPRLFHLPNVAVEYFGGTWVESFPAQKEFSTSFMFSLGANMPGMSGYEVRKTFLQDAPRVTAMPLRLYRGKRPYELSQDIPMLEDDKKDCLFRSMFHVAVENQVEPNYFTEKLVDCFASYTVPIYYGCTNIGEFFDMDGIIQASSSDEIIQILNDLSVSDYWRRMPAMQRNYVSSQKYWNIVVQLRDCILRHWQTRHSSAAPANTAFDPSVFRCPHTALVEIGTGDGQGTARAIRAHYSKIHTIEPSSNHDEAAVQLIREELGRSSSPSDVLLYQGATELALTGIWAQPGRQGLSFFFRAQPYCPTDPAAWGDEDLHPLLSGLLTLRRLYRDRLMPPIVFIEDAEGIVQASTTLFRPLTVAQIRAAVLAISPDYAFQDLIDENGTGILVAVPLWWARGGNYPLDKTGA